mgnify:CR=1 FL=1
MCKKDAKSLRLFGFSKKIMVPSKTLKFWSIVFLPFFGGKKPSKINRSVGSPEHTKEARTADAPGIGSTFFFAFVPKIAIFVLLILTILFFDQYSYNYYHKTFCHYLINLIIPFLIF